MNYKETMFSFCALTTLFSPNIIHQKYSCNNFIPLHLFLETPPRYQVTGTLPQ